MIADSERQDDKPASLWLESSALLTYIEETHGCPQSSHWLPCLLHIAQASSRILVLGWRRLLPVPKASLTTTLTATKQSSSCSRLTQLTNDTIVCRFASSKWVWWLASQFESVPQPQWHGYRVQLNAVGCPLLAHTTHEQKLCPIPSCQLD